MKKNLLLMIASAALLASCGSSSNVAAAPTLTEKVSAADVSASAKKAAETLGKATGFSIVGAADVSIDAKVTLPDESGNAKTLNEKASLSNLTLKESAAITDGKFAASGELSGKLSATLDVPAYDSKASSVAISSKSLDADFSAKDYLADDKVYLDGSGLYDAYSKVKEVAASVGAEFQGPASADDMKVFMSLQPGFCRSFGTLFSQQISLYSTKLIAMIQSYGDSDNLGKFSDGSYGFVVDIQDIANSAAGTSVDLGGATGKITVTFTEAGKFNVYGEFAGKVSKDLNQTGTQKVSADVNAKFSLGLEVADVTVEKVSDPSSYKEMQLPSVPAF